MLATAGGADIASYVGVPAVALRPLAPWVRGLSLQIRQRHGSVEQEPVRRLVSGRDIL